VSRKPFLTFVAIPAASVLAVLGVTACGNGSSDDATVVQAAATPQFLNESADRTAAVESGRFEMSVDVPASSQVPSGFSIEGSGAFDLANKKSDTTIDLGGLIDAAKAGENAESLALLGDGKFEIITDDASVYVKAGFLSAFLGGDNAKPWIKLPANDKSASVTNDLSGGLADATALLDLLRDKGATVTDQGQADVNGQSTHHFNATITVADALAAAPQASRERAHAFIDQLGAAEGNVKIPIDVFVDDQGLIRRMQMTFDGDVFKSLGGTDPQAAAAQGPITFTIDFLDLGQSVDIQLPPADQVGDASGFAKMFQDSASDTGS
jgi:hypothetical protein